MGDGMVWRKKVGDLLDRMFELQYGGATSTKFRWQQGYVDGYIQAFIDMGFMTEKDMIAVIQEERATFLSTHERVEGTLDEAA